MHSLTGLRGVAALTVLIAHGHFQALLPNLEPILRFFEWHALAVDLFFMMSGFVLMHVYGATLGQGQIKWTSYLWARFARVAPLYFVTLAATYGLQFIGWLMYKKWPVALTWKVAITNLLLVQNWPGLYQLSANLTSWSLSVEVFCYVVVFPIALLLSHRLQDHNWVRAIALVALVAWRLGTADTIFDWPSLARGIAGFLVGALLYGSQMLKNDTMVKWVTLVSLIVFIVLRSLATWSDLDPRWPLLAFPTLVLGLAQPCRDWVHRALESKSMQWLGDVSFSIYLWQLPVLFVPLYVVRPYLLGLPVITRVAWATLEFVLVLFFAHLSYLLIELPARQWLRTIDLARPVKH